MMRLNLKLILVVTLVLNGCSSGRYSMRDDKAPENAPNLDTLEQPIPRFEAPSKQGNRDYRVRGIDYRVMASAAGYKQQGVASWYGAKFHGHLTSNGETYDMYGFSAAHKGLPLPTYVKVTNLANQKSVIVRVNDRGPFHNERLIDLSYAAAYQLDMLKTGTAHVEVEAIATTPDWHPHLPKVSGNDKNHYIQVTALSNQDKVQELATRLEREHGASSRIIESGSLFKLQLGPLPNPVKAQELLHQLQRGGFQQAFSVFEATNQN